jgi:serine/threonine protein kinase/tetratricopeptide (TPR) repeat protein
MPERFAIELSDHYRIERELGRGGNAIVYLAHDIKHDRQVAIKVLLPELAESVRKDRFLREIRIAAKLTHSHILALHDSGEAAGTLYYVMPYVGGESLRQRLQREKQLSLDDALRVTREAASALDYAHKHGVLHRDIKPENILLQNGEAMVADFGIARALAEDGGDALTRVGIAVGTLEYMSPEQSAGNNIDGRSDQYALGCVLYEMLAGHPPFTGASAHEILSRHALDPVPRLAAARPDVPDSVEAAVRKALAKSPADRFATSADFAAALTTPITQLASTVTAPTAFAAFDPSTSFSRRHRKAILIASVAIAAVSAAGYAWARAAGIGPFGSLIASGALSEHERVVLGDFQTVRGDSTLAQAITQAFRISLSQSPNVTVLEPTHVAGVLARMSRSSKSRLDPELAREVALRDNVKAYIAGEVTEAGGRYVIAAKLVNAQTEAALAGFSATAKDSSEILDATDKVSRKLRARIGESLASVRADRALEAVTTSSLEALRLYSEGYRAAYLENNYDRAISVLREAVGLDSTFATAWWLLAAAYNNSAAGNDKAVDAARRAFLHRDRVTERERLHINGIYYLYVTGDIEKGVDAFTTELQRYPDDGLAPNSLGILYQYKQDFAKSIEMGKRAIVNAPFRNSGYQNLMQAYLWQGRFVDAENVVGALARQIQATNTNAQRIIIESARRNYDRVDSLVQRGIELAGSNAARRQGAYTLAGRLALTRGRLADAERYTREGSQAAAERGNSILAVRAALQQASVDLRVRLDRRRALRTLDAALVAYWSSIPAISRPYLLAAELYAFAGDANRARALLSDLRTAVPGDVGVDLSATNFGDRAAPALAATRGFIALDDAKPAEALASFREAAAGQACARCYDLGQALAFEKLGQRDSAIARLVHYTATTGAGRSLQSDAYELATSYEQLAELCELTGDRAKASTYATKFVQLWDHADAELQPRVAAKRALLRRLGRPD